MRRLLLNKHNAIYHDQTLAFSQLNNRPQQKCEEALRKHPDLSSSLLLLHVIIAGCAPYDP